MLHASPRSPAPSGGRVTRQSNGRRPGGCVHGSHPHLSGTSGEVEATPRRLG